MAVLASSEADIEYEIGVELLDSDPEKSLDHLAKALSSGSRELDLFINLSVLLIKFRKFEEAWKICELGQRFFKANATLLGNQGVACAQLCAFEQALALFRRQAKLLEKSKRPYTNIGNMLRCLGQVDEAISIYKNGLQYDDSAQFNLASALLLRGDLQEGFREFEGRASLKNESITAVPFWDGAGVPAEHLLLYCEQGIGDAIQCARYIDELNRRGIEPVFGLPANTHRLFSGLPGKYTISANRESAASAGCQAAIFSLPYLLGTDLDSIPEPIPFSVPKDLKSHWQRKLRPASGVRVALVWAGNPEHGNDHNRSIPLDLFQRILEGQNATFLSVQMGKQSSQIAELGLQSRVQDLSPLITDFADTAAILSHVDLLISVDTSVAHLAGNQGVPVWTLITYAPDWRWMLNRDDSPWYPSMRLFRQPRPRDWESVVERVREELVRFTSASAARVAAEFIPRHAQILDFTSGSAALSAYLPKGAAYCMCNIIEQELPASTSASHLTLLGVLDQVDNWQGLLQYCRGLNRPLTISYHPADATTVAQREALGCANHLTLQELAAALHSIGFSIVGSAPVGGTEAVLHLAPACDSVAEIAPGANVEKSTCPVCRETCQFLDVLDFNKACLEGPGNYQERSGLSIYYALCSGCGFCFAPQMANWTPQEFESRVYNEEYLKFDPEYVKIRPENNARNLISMFGEKPALKHLDYGGGNGLLSRTLQNSGWDSLSYDPFSDKHVHAEHLGKFDLITAFEVFEHVPDVQDLMAKLSVLSGPDTVILFSTLLSDGNLELNQRITWWYASPRNGHISLFSRASLSALAGQHGFQFGSFSPSFHSFFRQLPSWAGNLIRLS